MKARTALISRSDIFSKCKITCLMERGWGVDDKDRERLKQMYGLMLQMAETLNDIKKFSWLPTGIIAGILIAILFRITQIVV